MHLLLQQSAVVAAESVRRTSLWPCIDSRQPLCSFPHIFAPALAPKIFV
jgi:hypothetical protein